LDVRADKSIDIRNVPEQTQQHASPLCRQLFVFASFRFLAFLLACSIADAADW